MLFVDLTTISDITNRFEADRNETPLPNAWSALGRLVASQPGGHVNSSHGSSVEVSLGLVNSEGSQNSMLILLLDPLGNHSHSERVRDVHDSSDHRAVACVINDAVDEALVDLHLVDR